MPDDPRAKFIKEASHAASPAPLAAGQRVEVTAPGTAATAEQHMGLMDVLDNLPTAKPTEQSLRTQLTAPILLAAKCGYDFCAALADIASHGFQIKSVIFLALNADIGLVAFRAWGSLKQTYRSALDKKDPHYERARARLRYQLIAHGLLPPEAEQVIPQEFRSPALGIDLAAKMIAETAAREKAAAPPLPAVSINETLEKLKVLQASVNARAEAAKKKGGTPT